MKVKRIIALCVCLLLLAVGVFLNQRFEVIAFHPLNSSDCSECSDPSTYSGQGVLKVMTWNVHCSNGADSVRQQRIAELILQADADFVLLNEFHQDSCWVMDSLLKVRYPYIEEALSHGKCGDIFYSKRKMTNSGRLSIRKREPYRRMKWKELPDSIRGKSLQTLRATIALGSDSVQIFGMHMASNRGDESAIINRVDSLKKIDSFYERYLKAQENRSFQARWTNVFIEESSHPVIVMGDMNDFNCSTTLNILSSSGLKDAWWEGGFGYGCTFHAGWMRLRIDHILYKPAEVSRSSKVLQKGSGLELTNVKVIDTELSDHNPLIASFKLVDE